MTGPLSSEPTSAPVPPADLICPRCRRRPAEGCGLTGEEVDIHGSERHLRKGVPLVRCPSQGSTVFVEREAFERSRGDTLLGRTVADRYLIVERLGSGAMGAVYRARHANMNRDVALKLVRRERIFDAETRVRFEREAHAMSALVNPHTVTVFDFGEADDGWYLAMELLRGETVGQRLKRDGAIDWRVAVRVARETLSSLAEAHGKGIVHRDLKPDNLFLATVPTDSGGAMEVCKVLDFGIAKLIRPDERVDQLETQAGTVFGTPRYMSPEQAQGNALDQRSDLYSLGVILFQMIAGRAPFVDDDAVVVMARHIKEPPPAIRAVADGASVPTNVERVLRRALEKDPLKRPQTAAEFSAELEAAAAAADGLMTGAYSNWTGPSSTVGIAARRRRIIVGAAAATATLTVLLAIGAWALVRGLGEPATSTASRSRATGLPPAAPLASTVDEASSSVAPEPPSEPPPTTSPAADASAVPSASAAPGAAPGAAPAVRPRPAVPAPPVGVKRKPGDRYGRFGD